MVEHAFFPLWDNVPLCSPGLPRYHDRVPIGSQVAQEIVTTYVLRKLSLKVTENLEENEITHQKSMTAWNILWGNTFWAMDYSFENKQMLLIVSKEQLDLSTGIDHVHFSV